MLNNWSNWDINIINEILNVETKIFFTSTLKRKSNKFKGDIINIIVYLNMFMLIANQFNESSIKTVEWIAKMF